MTKRVRCPREPSAGECCGSGCSRCVYDVYYDALKAYEEQKHSSTEDDDEFTDGSSEEDEDVKDYIGSVVIKYLGDLPSKDVERAEDRIRKELESKYTALESVQFVKSSDKVTDAPSINILSAQPVSNIPTPHPGDTVEVFVPNDHSALDNCVEHLCRRLMVSPDAGCVLQCSPFVPEEHFPSWLPMGVPLTVRQLLSNYVDISSCSYLLRPTFFQSLLRLYNNDQQRGKASVVSIPTGSPGTPELLEQCASATDAVEVFRCILNRGSPLCYPCLTDVLDLFPFVKLPLERMLEITGPLQARKFSVAGYEALSQDRVKCVELCLRQVVASRGVPSGVGGGANETALHLANVLNSIAIQRAARDQMRSSLFYGHTTSPLVWEAIRGAGSGPRWPFERKIYMGTSLFGTSSFSQELKMALYQFISGGIKLRGAPVIMVGAGTGIAPLIAGVRELMRGRKEKGVSSSTPPYECTVMYGSRTKEELIYHETLLAARGCGAISSYDYALSRQPNEGKAGDRVTDLIEKNSAYIRDSLLCLQGKLFCCGPSKAMESIRTLLEKKILADPDDDESMQQHRIHFLAEKKQIMFDVWTAIDFMN